MTDERAEMLRIAHELAPKLAERAAATEANRAPLDETVTDLINSGLLSIMTPKAYGGLELGLDVMSEVIQILSAADGSSGWNAAFYLGAPWRVNIFSEQAQKEAFDGKNYLLMCGAGAMLDKVTRVEGGYRITGQTAWNSGSVHAEWFNFAGIPDVPGDLVPPLLFLVPREDVEILDTWYIKGMSGTGSNDCAVHDVFVPEHRVGSFAMAMGGQGEGQQIHSDPVYQLPFLAFALAEVVPVVTGIMRGAAEAFVERTRIRQSSSNSERAAESQSAQMRLGRALAAADAAESLAKAYRDALGDAQLDKRELNSRADFKLRAAFITDLCRTTVNDLVRGIGGDGFRDSSALQRHFRDLQVLAVHAFLNIDTAAETKARFALDLPITDRLV